jgi:hypothetical protein
LSVVVCDLPDRAWTAGDVTDALRSCPDWLRDARCRQAVAEEQRKARFAAVEARKVGFTYPTVSTEAAKFAREVTRLRLLEFLRRALNAAAADTYVEDLGYDGSTYASPAAETNWERARRGDSLSGLDDRDFSACGMYREQGSLGDLFDAPTGYTRATFISGAGFVAQTWADVWEDEWTRENLDLAYVVADLTLNGDTATLEVIAEAPLGDTDLVKPASFHGIAADVLLLARQALYSWTEIECPVLVPDEVVDMTMPVSALPGLLLGARHDWTRTEQLAAVLARVADGPAGLTVGEDG